MKLNAAELPRFMACNGSKFMNGLPSAFSTKSRTADEGSAAHWAATQLVKYKVSPETLLNKKSPNGVYITQEMLDNLSKFVEDCKSLIGNSNVEYSFCGPDNSWSVEGVVDFVGVENDTMYIADLKYGFRIVEPEDNWTLICHAIGNMHRYNPEKVCVRIYQPRPYHPKGTVREVVYSKEYLLERYNEMVAALCNPEKIVRTSEHCDKCPHFSQCPAAKLSIAKAIEACDIAYDEEIGQDELGYTLSFLKKAEEKIKQALLVFEDLAILRLKQGERVKGFSALPKLGNTCWKNKDVEATFSAIQALSGIDVTEKKLVTPSEAIRRGVPKEVLEPFVERPNIGFKLVQMDENETAEAIFGKGVKND